MRQSACWKVFWQMNETGLPGVKRKKALILTTVSGFLSKFEMQDVEILKTLGYEIHYASNFQNPVYRFDIEELKTREILLHPIAIEKSPAAYIQNAKAIRQVKELIERENIDLIHCHNPMGGVVGRVAAKASRRNPYVIYTAHGFHFYQGASLGAWLCCYPAERLLAHWTDVLITINREDFQYARKFRLKKDGFAGRIHGTGIDLKRFQQKPEIRECKRRELGIAPDAFHLITIAEINENKNQKVVIEALAGLEGIPIRYSICGKGPAEEGLYRLIQEKGLEGRVKLLGYRTDVEEILQTADVFVFPSIREGLGLAPLEALACGVPLIVSDNRGSREYAKADVNARICAHDSAEEFRESICRLYKDPEYRKQLSAACRQSAEPFGAEQVQEEMRRIYKKADEKVESRRKHGRTDKE